MLTLSITWILRELPRSTKSYGPKASMYRVIHLMLEGMSLKGQQVQFSDFADEERETQVTCPNLCIKHQRWDINPRPPTQELEFSVLYLTVSKVGHELRSLILWKTSLLCTMPHCLLLKIIYVYLHLYLSLYFSNYLSIWTDNWAIQIILYINQTSEIHQSM